MVCWTWIPSPVGATGCSRGREPLEHVLVSESQVPHVRQYILSQEEHYRAMPFKNEYLEYVRLCVEEEHIG
jgi:hypothetical protein